MRESGNSLDYFTHYDNKKEDITVIDLNRELITCVRDSLCKFEPQDIIHHNKATQI